MPCRLPSATISRISSSVCSMMPLPWLMRWIGHLVGGRALDHRLHRPRALGRRNLDPILAAIVEPLLRGGQIVGIARGKADAGQKVARFTHERIACGYL